MNEQSILEAHERLRAVLRERPPGEPTTPPPGTSDTEADDGTERTNPDAA
jgi:hypothetical protein